MDHLLRHVIILKSPTPSRKRVTSTICGAGLPARAILPARFSLSPETAALGASPAAATAPAEAVSAAPAAAFLAWPSFIDIDRASAHFRAVQTLNRAGRLVCVRHLDESETARLAGIPVSNDAHAFDGAESSE